MDDKKSNHLFRSIKIIASGSFGVMNLDQRSDHCPRETIDANSLINFLHRRIGEEDEILPKNVNFLKLIYTECTLFFTCSWTSEMNKIIQFNKDYSVQSVM